MRTRRIDGAEYNLEVRWKERLRKHNRDGFDGSITSASAEPGITNNCHPCLKRPTMADTHHRALPGKIAEQQHRHLPESEVMYFCER
jgi:hypothetical protein